LAEIVRQKRKRKLVQTAALILGNAWLPGFYQATIYRGPLKALCLPGLNCYSCPGALGACPLGSLQNALADPLQRISFYVLGFLVLLGGLFGRFICGWLCPFGLVQEWMNRLPLPKWRPGPHSQLNQGLSSGKLILLAGLVLILPVAGMLIRGFGDPAFCKWFCPSGTLMAGIPLMIGAEPFRALAGWLFGWKVLVLLGVAVAAMFVFRPFCRYLCPLGAIYGFFNAISLYRVEVDAMRCNECGACTRHCPMSVPVPEKPNVSACIRCGECAAVCPQQAIHVGFSQKPVPEKATER
jgi:polyferredoxin